MNVAIPPVTLSLEHMMMFTNLYRSLLPSGTAIACTDEMALLALPAPTCGCCYHCRSGPQRCCCGGCCSMEGCCCRLHARSVRRRRRSPLLRVTLTRPRSPAAVWSAPVLRLVRPLRLRSPFRRWQQHPLSNKSPAALRAAIAVAVPQQQPQSLRG